jgi:hypothetical protein
MPEGVVIGILLCALVIGVAVETLIGAVILRAAVALCNKLEGGDLSPRSVPEPAFGKAMGIIFATSVARVIVGLLIDGLFMDGAAAAGTGGMVAQLISFPVSLLIMAEMLSTRLPTTFGGAILVTLCYVLVSLLVAGVLVGIAVLVFAVVSRGA